ncbi:ABC transporter ATP-binding protein [Pectinatus sottacetonis]|uniref:ABC transporter ATP-binding protein n=1 Tax=Pectinatus sottacetonis TaxID=1002795 RepID=UPI0018C7FFFD|nr:ABC transporter ATP-binding protein [Pectinatus sottacetonis]
MNDVMVEVKNINKIYGNTKVVKDVSFCVYKGEFLTILGSSGSGKTTTLRMIAGFERANSGQIFIEGENVAAKEPYEREINTVFQNYALFPHMNVFDNIAYGLKMKKIPKKQIKEKVTNILQLVQLEGFGTRKIDELSGGQKQRIAIARAIVNNPKVLLLDEPLGALDLKLRKQMQFELKQLQKKIGITFIYVTHDQEEALSMSDRIAIMHDGCMEQISTPKDIYEKPISRFIADFIGESNIFDGKVKTCLTDFTELETSCGIVYAQPGTFLPQEAVCISIRPEKIYLSTLPTKKAKIKGKIYEQVYRGSSIRSFIMVKGLDNGLKVDIPSNKNDFRVGQEVYVNWEPSDAFLISEKAADKSKPNLLVMPKPAQGYKDENTPMMEKAI